MLFTICISPLMNDIQMEARNHMRNGCVDNNIFYNLFFLTRDKNGAEECLPQMYHTLKKQFTS